MAMEKGFLGSLFDMSFTEFVTTRIVHILYIIAIALSGLAALGALATGFASGSVGGILAGLIVAPILFVFWVLCARVWLEVIVVAFRIAENTGRLVEQQGGDESTAGNQQ